MPEKTNIGNFFEDFELGQETVHATPRTLTEGDVALYTSLYGTRFALNSSDVLASDLGLPGAPIDDLLVFHTVFGKTVPDISLNAVANLGYASGVFGVPVYPGDTLSAQSEVIGLKENSNGKAGVVYVRSTGQNQDGRSSGIGCGNAANHVSKAWTFSARRCSNLTGSSAKSIRRMTK